MTSSVALQTYLSRIQDVRREVQRSGEAVGVWGVTARFLDRVQQRLTRLPRVAIIGETNTGKTTLANMLLGHDLLVTDIFRNTRAPIFIRHAPRAQLTAVGLDGSRQALQQSMVPTLQRDSILALELGLPLEPLRRFEIIDSPGLSELTPHADRLAFVCRNADLAVWSTLATQAWRASEREVWRTICPRVRTASLLAVTHADALSQAERERVEERLRREAGPLFSGLAMIAQAPSDATVAGQDADALAAAFRSKLDGALEQVRQRRLAGARRAVSRFMQRLETGATVPLVPFRAAS